MVNVAYVAYTAHADVVPMLMLVIQGGTEKLSESSFRWAAATLLSRSFSLDIETGACGLCVG